MSQFILLDSKEKVLALKVGDRVRIDPNGREFSVCESTVNPKKIYFHGGWKSCQWNQSEQDVIYIRKRHEDMGVVGVAVWLREELWEALQNPGSYYVS